MGLELIPQLCICCWACFCIVVRLVFRHRLLRTFVAVIVSYNPICFLLDYGLLEVCFFLCTNFTRGSLGAWCKHGMYAWESPKTYSALPCFRCEERLGMHRVNLGKTFVSLFSALGCIVDVFLNRLPFLLIFHTFPSFKITFSVNYLFLFYNRLYNNFIVDNSSAKSLALCKCFI